MSNINEFEIKMSFKVGDRVLLNYNFTSNIEYSTAVVVQPTISGNDIQVSNVGIRDYHIGNSIFTTSYFISERSLSLVSRRRGWKKTGKN